MSGVETFTAASLPAGLDPKEWEYASALGDGSIRYPRPTVALAREIEHAVRGAKASLDARPAQEILRVVSTAAARFLDPLDPLRQRAEAMLPGASGLSATMSRLVIEGMAADWTEEEAWPAHRKMARAALNSKDAAEGSRAFAEKRQPVWRGE